MELLAVNFHNMGIPEHSFPGVHSLGCDAFTAKIEALADLYEMISLDDVVRAIAGDRDLPSRSCLITFDDGLRCQMEIALPILDRQKVPAAFFVLGGPLRDGKGASVHKIQWTRAILGDEAVCREIEKMTRQSEERLVPADMDRDKASLTYPYDPPEAAQLKWYLNYYLDQGVRDAMVARLLSLAGFSEGEFIEKIYMRPAHVRELSARNWLGSHGISHRPLSGLSVAEKRFEINESKRFLEDVGKRPVVAFSYPGGRATALDGEALNAVVQAGYVCGWTMERAFNSNLSDPRCLARVDANDIDDLQGIPAREADRNQSLESRN